MVARVQQWLRDPLTWTSAAQLLKTVIAAVIAWILAVRVFGLSQGFMAPWAALLTVNATVLGTLRRGLQQAAASVLGVLIAFAAGRLFGLDEISVGTAILAGLLAGSVWGVRAEGTTTAATALVVLTTGYSTNGGLLATRLLDTGIGIAVGLLTNFLAWPPLRDRAAARAIDAIAERIGELLSGMAGDLRAGTGQQEVDEWIARTNQLDDDVDHARRLLEQARESGRLNPRRSARGRMRAAHGFEAILSRLDQAVAETRSMARTVQLSSVAPDRWDPRFRSRWLKLLERSGAAVTASDLAGIQSARAGLGELARELVVRELEGDLWPVYGALTVNLRNIDDALDAVAKVQPVEVPSPAALRARPGPPRAAPRS
jgi:uncharacterized membrane protein YgaE (UPF0421/DUF939 family)